MRSKEPLIKSWMNSLSPDFPIAALASTCNSPAHKHISIALENSESQSASPRLNQRLPNNKDEQGHTNPLMTLAIMVIVGILTYLAFDSINPDDPSTTSMYSMYTTWLSWPWWARGLFIFSPVVLLLIGSRLDNASRFGKLP